MKKTLLSLLITIGITATAQVKIGNNPTNVGASSLLELESTNKALLLPRVPNTAAIASPVNGMMIYDVSVNCFRSYENNSWSICWGQTPGTIATLNCAGATNTGTLTNTVVASGVSSSVPYTGGNGAAHTGQIVTSTGVLGLTATLTAGTFATGAGTLTYTITGTPTSVGTASFALNIGGKTCALNISVFAVPPGPINFSNCATVFSGISFTSQAEYNNGARVIEMVNIGGTTTYNNNLTSPPNSNWTPQGALYSESNFNDVCTSTKANIHSAATWTNSAINANVNLSGSGGLVLDLQSFKEVDVIAVYNTPSDGKISHFKIDYSTSATPPSYSNEAQWTNIIPTTQVNNIQPTGNSSVFGISLAFAMTSRVNARYWRVRVWNTGLHGPTGNSYIEIRQVKLMKYN
jgi:hypothetical protein